MTSRFYLYIFISFLLFLYLQNYLILTTLVVGGLYDIFTLNLREFKEK